MAKIAMNKVKTRDDPPTDGEGGMNDPNGAEQVKHGADEEEKIEKRGQNIANSSHSGNRTSRELEQSNNGPDNVRERGESDINSSNNDFWEQMTAREGRVAARRAGMRPGDWQAQMQLQEALRESRRDAATSTALEEKKSGRSDDPALFPVEIGVVGDGETCASSPSLSSLSDRSDEGRVGREDAASAFGVEEEKGGNDDELEVEEDEDFGDQELVVTQDGGVIPMKFAVGPVGKGAGQTVAAMTKSRPRGSEGSATPQAGGEHRRKRGGRRKQRSGTRRSGAAASAVTSTSVPGDDQLRKKKIRDEKSEVQHGIAMVDTVVSGGVTDGGKREADGDDDGKMATVAASAAVAAVALMRRDLMLTLPDDVLHRTMLFLHPEDIFECRAVNSQWSFPQHEAVFEGLCRRTYLAQSAKKLLNVKYWRSWQNMFKLRPRLRDSGLYSLKTTYFKKPVRDMSTSWVPGIVLEVSYYRYFKFFGDGRVAYALTYEPPQEFIRLLQEGSPKVSYGTYTISKWEVRVEIPQPLAFVSFSLQLANGERGRFTHLVLLSHSSVSRNNPRSGRCHHQVKSTDLFTFRRFLQF